MRPPPWRPPVDPSTAEQTILRRIKRAILFVFLRQHRQVLVDDAFQAEPIKWPLKADEAKRGACVAACAA